MLFDILYEYGHPADYEEDRADLLAEAKEVFLYNRTTDKPEAEPDHRQQASNASSRAQAGSSRMIISPALPAPVHTSAENNTEGVAQLFEANVATLPHISSHSQGAISISSGSEEAFLPSDPVPSTSQQRPGLDHSDRYLENSFARPQQQGEKRSAEERGRPSKRARLSQATNRASTQRTEHRSAAQNPHGVPKTWDWRYLLLVIDYARSCQPPETHEWPPTPRWLSPSPLLADVIQYPTTIPHLKAVRNKDCEFDDDRPSLAVDALKLVYKSSILNRAHLKSFYDRASQGELEQMKTFTQIARLKKDVFGRDGVCEKLVRQVGKMAPTRVASFSPGKTELARDLLRHVNDHPRYFELASSLISHEQISLLWDPRLYLAILEFAERFNVDLGIAISQRTRQIASRPRFRFDIVRKDLPPLADFPKVASTGRGSIAAGLSALGYLYYRKDLVEDDLASFNQYAPMHLKHLLEDLSIIADLRHKVTKEKGGVIDRLHNMLTGRPHLATRSEFDLVSRLAKEPGYCFRYFASTFRE